jgi:hypothetical protein
MLIRILEIYSLQVKGFPLISVCDEGTNPYMYVLLRCKICIVVNGRSAACGTGRTLLTIKGSSEFNWIVTYGAKKALLIHFFGLENPKG